MPAPLVTPVEAPATRPLVWDNHACMPLSPGLLESALEKLDRFKGAGVDVVSLNVGYGQMPVAHSLAMLDAIHAWVANNSDHVCVLAGPEDLDDLRPSGRLGLVFDIEGIGILPGQLDQLTRLAMLGVRWASLAYNRSNALAGGCHDRDDGLTPAGRLVIDHLDAAGITVCCSHVGQKTARDILSYATRPVIFSHSNLTELCDHPRNVSTTLLRACTSRGGMVGINGVNIFLGPGAPTVARLADHILMAASACGSERVSLALDSYFGGELRDEVHSSPKLFPAVHGYESIEILGPEALAPLRDELVRRGMDLGEIAGVFGENLVRFARENWPRGKRHHQSG